MEEETKIEDHEFVNPCWCGCDGSEMKCGHHDENGHECLKDKSEHSK